ANDLASLSTSVSWRVRRTAIESLAEIGLPQFLDTFDDNKHTSVTRAIFKARLKTDADPSVRIYQELRGSDTTRSEQMAFALMDSIGALSIKFGNAGLVEILSKLIAHMNPVVQTIGFLIIEQSSDAVRRHFKNELLTAALDSDDTFINALG